MRQRDETRGAATEARSSVEAEQEPLLALGATLALGAVLALLSTTLVSVGIGRLAEEFSAPLSTVQWVSTAYLLALAVSIPAAGWAMDRFGEKRLWQVSLVVYLVGCGAAALARTVDVLIAARVVQGVGAAMFEPIMLTMLARAAGPRRVTRVMSLVQIPITMAPVFGPVVGGVLLNALDWQWLFWLNVPVGVLCALLAQRLLPQDPPRASRSAARLDVTGLALLPAGLAALMLGLSQAAGTGTGDGGGAPARDLLVPVSLLAGTLLFVGYVVHALRTRKAPLIDLRLFGAGPALSAGFTSVAPQSAGRASSVLIAAIQLGGSVGTALLAVVLQRQLAHTPTAAVAYAATFWWTLALCALGAVTALFLPRSERS
ncbi:MFS transporter [Streptomyces nigrescens]|uniref:MFS transporter n=1 Tax=Streptomyces nigrescens TaxID=1920 RepID=A0ABN6QTF7_STRNI|nr:MFS transporter [Streptomyces nigrescens]BDM69295.1 MFS transporter [Streptomyces nigrescens]